MFAYRNYSTQPIRPTSISSIEMLRARDGFRRLQLKATGISTEAPAVIRREITTQLEALNTAYLSHTANLNLQRAEFAHAFRASPLPAQLPTRWPAGESPATLDRDAAELPGLIGYGSDLVLDPEHNSYYLINVLLNPLTRWQTRAATAAASSFSSLRKGALSPTARQSLATDAALLRDANFPQIKSELLLSLGDKDATANAAPALNERIKSTFGAFGKATATLTASLQSLASGESTTTTKLLANQTRAALGSAAELKTATLNTVEQILQLASRWSVIAASLAFSPSVVS